MIKGNLFTKVVLLLLIQISFIYGCSSNNPTSQNEQEEESESISLEDKLVVRYLNLVSEEKAGDAIFIQTPDSVTMLIDAGRTSVGSQVDDFLEKSDVSRIDYAVATHPHIDHIGGYLTVLESYEVDKLLMSNVSHDASYYEEFINLVGEQEIDQDFIEGGEEFTLGNEVTVEVFNPPAGTEPPNSTTITALNDLSLVLKVTYGENSFLFTGDINMNREQKLVDKYGGELKADVLDAPHHGLDTSSSLNFLQTVAPDIIVTSQNDASRVVDSYVYARYNNYGSDIYITGRDGNITLFSDGKDIDLPSKKENKLKLY